MTLREANVLAERGPFVEISEPPLALVCDALKVAGILDILEIPIEGRVFGGF